MLNSRNPEKRYVTVYPRENYFTVIVVIGKKEGFYRFDNTTNIDMIVMLNTDVPTKLIIFDDEMNIKFLSDLPYKNKLYICGFHINQIVGIVGEGDVAISFEPINQ